MVNNGILPPKVAMLPIPLQLLDKIAIDRANGHVYVDKRSAGDPNLLTWQDRNKANGLVFKIKPSDVDEVAKLREGGMRAYENTEDDLLVRNHAIEIITTAAKYNASDIHIMMRGSYTEIQIVVKGGLRVLKRISQEEGTALARAIYQGIAKVRDSSYNPLDFQNAQISSDALPNNIGVSSIRIVRGPSYPQARDGAFMTMRLQFLADHKSACQSELAALEFPRKPDGVFRLGVMGYTPSQVEKINELMDAPNGLILFTGPTGSGKTTAMFQALQQVARTKPHRRLVTIEDPVEYPMEWAVQMAITGAKNDKETGDAFGERVRVALRMAPNNILLGELRGPEVAVAALEAAVTGHQVWSTMHVTDPFLFVDRLELMDKKRLDRRVFCDHKLVRGVIAQRLLPKLCTECSVLLSDEPNTLSKRIVNSLQTWGDLSKVKVRGAGCSHCGYDGTVGRFAVAEILVTDAAVMSDFISHGSDVARKNHRKKPGSDVSMLESSIKYSLAGIVDPRSIEDSIDLIEPKGKE